MITYSWKNLLPDLHFFKVGTHILGGGYLALQSCYKFRTTMMHMDMMDNDSEHKLFNSESLPTIQYYQQFGYELTLKNSEVNIISEKTCESACAILPSKTLPNHLACTMEHHHKLDSRRVSCCLLSSSSFLVSHFPANIVCSECEL